MFKGTDKYMALAAVCMLTFSACSSDDALSSADKEGGGKTPIELTAVITGESPSTTTRSLTRTVVTTDKTNNPAKPFSGSTSLYMVVQSDNGSSPTSSLYTRTIGFATGIASPTTKTSSDVSLTGNNIRYWEDSYSRNSYISIYSLCVPNTSNDVLNSWATIGTSNAQWDTEVNNGSTTIDWPLHGTTSVSPATQDATFITNQDLCFSNNVSNLTATSTARDERLKFTKDGTTQKWSTNSGKMIFYHALTKVTFKVVVGAGFTGTNDFEFSNSDENIVLNGFNTSGTFDITTGEFTPSGTTTTTIKKLAAGAAEDGFKYILNGLILPGTNLSSGTGNVHFTIDGNLYTITMAQLATALSGQKTSLTNSDALDGGKMRPGVHYIFTLTVGKTPVVNVTAALADWEQVNVNMTPTNARITVACLDHYNIVNDANKAKRLENTQYDLYRTAYTHTSINDDYADYANWKTGYTVSGNKAVLIQGSIDRIYGAYSSYESAANNTPWYWPDNKTFYHFRTVAPRSVAVAVDNKNTTDDTTDDVDYITLTAASSYTDVCWGAPFYKYTENNTSSTSPTPLIYSTDTGFDNTTGSGDDAKHQIYKAIGPTNSTIILQMFHMMSHVTINITSTGNDKLDNLNGTKIKISGFYPTGNVLMGNGLVIPDATTGVSTVNDTFGEATEITWQYGFIPQDLTGVQLIITSHDNQYIVDLKDVIVKTKDDKGNAITPNPLTSNLIANPYSETVSGNGKYLIDRWYPNFKYTYTFNLTKSGIASITATLADWETVEASQDVQIK